MIRNTLHIILLMISWIIYTPLFGQQLEGVVTFRASENIYVRFSSTADIAIGDTLYFSAEKEALPCMVVKQKSSSSCICLAINDCQVVKDDQVIHQRKNLLKPDLPVNDKAIEDKVQEINKDPLISELAEEDPDIKQTEVQKYQERVRARISAASYSNLSNQEGQDRHRTMLRMSMDMDHIGGSKWSFESYLNYRKNFLERPVDPDYQTSFFNVYNVALTYDVDSTMHISIGRKINRSASSLGPIDGLQAEKHFGALYIGAIGGFRPDIQTFGFNSNLFEYGGYLGVQTKGRLSSQTTVGLLEQTNAGATDRRYTYLQHSSYLGNLNIFSSIELDIYDRINGIESTNPRLTNLFVSLRYRLGRRIQIMTSYDNRRRVVFYETLRTDVERLLADDEARQGIRGRINIMPLKYINAGVSYAKRFQSDNQNASDNINGYISHSRLPGLGGRLVLNYNQNRSNYLQSTIWSLRHSRTLIKNKVNADFYARIIDYNYLNSEITSMQQYYGANLSLRLSKTLRFNILGEWSTRRDENNIRINTKIIKRFDKR